MFAVFAACSRSQLGLCSCAPVRMVNFSSPAFEPSVRRQGLTVNGRPTKRRTDRRGARTRGALEGRAYMRGVCPEPDSNRYAREGQRGLSSPCLRSTIRAGHELRIERSEPIGTHRPNSARAMRCCLILLMSEDASAPGTGHPHLPIAFRATAARVWGMTEFHRTEGARWDPLRRTEQRLYTSGPMAASSPGMTRAAAVRPKTAPGTGTTADYTTPIGRDDGTRPLHRRRPDRSTLP